MLRIQPPVGVKFACIISPQFLGHIDPNDGDADGSPFGEKDVVDELAGRGADGVGEWEGVVDIDLREWKVKTIFKRSCKSQLHTSLINSGALGCVLSTSDVNASR